MKNPIGNILNRDSDLVLKKNETLLVCDSLFAYYKSQKDENLDEPAILEVTNAILTETLAHGFMTVHDIRIHLYELDIQISELDNYENF